MDALYHPVARPKDLDILQETLRISGINRALSTPYSPSDTTWMNDSGSFDLYHVGSPVPNIAASDHNKVEQYHKYFLDLVVTNKTNRIADLLYPFGTSYLLFNNDTIEPFAKER